MTKVAATGTTAVAIDLQALLALANDSSAESRRALTRIIGDLFAERGSVLSGRERALMSDILGKLIGQFEQAVRKELAMRLADSAAVPSELVVLLANDEIEVARPILLHSTVLSDEELIGIIHRRTMEHQLAIAMRRSLSARVSAALAETENVDVVRALLENDQAEISAATMEYLVEESRRVDDYQEPLLRREHLDPSLARRMYWWVSAALRSYIVRNFDIDLAQLDDEIEETIARLAGCDGQVGTADGETRPDAQPGVRSHGGKLAAQLARAGLITPELLVRTLRQGQILLFEHLFAAATGLDPARIGRILFDPSARMLTIACRAIGMDREHFAAIYLLRRQSGDRRVRDPRELSHIMRLFDSIGAADARQVVRQWRRNPAYVAAIEQIEAT